MVEDVKVHEKQHCRSRKPKVSTYIADKRLRELQVEAEKSKARVQVNFRISPFAMEKLRQAATLFDLEPSQYCKAVIFKDLGIFSEPLDMRLGRWKRTKKKRSEVK